MTGEKTQTDQQKMKVFVSYSRRDVQFADQIVYALEQLGFRPILDRHDIDAAERWQGRLGKLLLSADAVVFILTEQSAGSPVCAWEIDEADRLAKRMIPILPEPLPQGVDRPEKLSELNEIKFYADADLPGSGFAKGQFDLAAALRTNLEWVRSHTDFSEQAAKWESLGRSEDFLLRGAALDAALEWRSETPDGEDVEPSVLAFLNASTDYADKIKRELDSQIAEREKALENKIRAERYRNLYRTTIAIGTIFFLCFTALTIRDYIFLRSIAYVKIPLLLAHNETISIMGDISDDIQRKNIYSAVSTAIIENENSSYAFGNEIPIDSQNIIMKKYGILLCLSAFLTEFEFSDKFRDIDLISTKYSDEACEISYYRHDVSSELMTFQTNYPYKSFKSKKGWEQRDVGYLFERSDRIRALDAACNFLNSGRVGDTDERLTRFPDYVNSANKRSALYSQAIQVCTRRASIPR